MLQASLNIWAILVAAVVVQGIGMIWYSPALFGKQWSKLMGFKDMSPEQSKKMKEYAKPGYLGTFLASVILAAVLSVMIQLTSSNSVREGILIAAIAWLGFVATITFINAVYANKPLAVYMIDAGYQFVSFLVIAAIVTAWPF